MNRNDEMNALLAELKDTPPELNYAFIRAKARKNRAMRRIFAPISSLCSLVLVFILLINVSPGFASACSGIPLIGRLVDALEYNPSLQVAIENDYFQAIDEEQSDNGVNCRLLGVIVDRKQLNIFYTLSSKRYDDLGSDMEIFALDGTELTGISSGGSWRAEDDGVIRKRVDFFQNEMPEGVLFRTSAMTDSNTTVAEFEFKIEFDPYFTAQGETMVVNRDFTIDGNTFTVESIEMYPTQMRINISDDEHNSSWLKGLDFAVVNDRGEQFSSIRNGISAMGDTDGEGYAAFMLDSPYFFSSESLTLEITGVQWLSKDAPNVYVDMKNGVAENLPYDTEFLSAYRAGSDWSISFKVKSRGGNSGYNFHQALGSQALDADGKEYHIGSFGSTIGWTDPVTGERIEEEGYFTEELWIENYPHDEIWLKPIYTHMTELSEPVVVKLK